jgi:hypothetical protein
VKLLLEQDKGNGAGGGSSTDGSADAGTKTALGSAAANAGKGDATSDAGGEQTKPAETAKADAAKADADKAAAASKEQWAKWAPKAVEGLKRDDAQLGKFRELAAKHGLKPETAQDLVDLSDELGKNALAAAEKARKDSLEQTLAGWKDAVKNHKELGGAKLKETLADVDRAMAKYAKDDPELIKFLEETGIGDHPKLVEFVARIGRDLREDSLQDGAKKPASNAKPKTLPELLYGSPTQS